MRAPQLVVGRCYRVRHGASWSVARWDGARWLDPLLDAAVATPDEAAPMQRAAAFAYPDRLVTCRHHPTRADFEALPSIRQEDVERLTATWRSQARPRVRR